MTTSVRSKGKGYSTKSLYLRLIRKKLFVIESGLLVSYFLGSLENSRNLPKQIITYKVTTKILDTHFTNRKVY